MANNPVASICSACTATLREGQSALYDDYRDQHFCGRQCYDDWWEANTEVLKREYFVLNVEKCDL